jgi:hypothetical protein
MFWLGVVCIIMLLIYLVLMPCYIMDMCTQRSKYKEQKNKELTNQSIIDDILQHSSLYAQNDLSPNGTVKVKNIVAVETTLYEYPVGRF